MSAVQDALALGDHLTQMFELAKQREGNRHAEAMTRSRNRPWVVVVILSVFFLFILLFSLIAFIYGHGDQVLPVIGTLIGLVGAAGGAYGYAKYEASKAVTQDSPPPPPA